MNKINFWKIFIIGILLTTSIILCNYHIKYNFIISYIYISLLLLYMFFLLLHFKNKRELTNNNPIIKNKYKIFKFRLVLTTMLLQLCYLFYLYFFTNKEEFAKHFFLVSLVSGGLLLLFDMVMKKIILKKSASAKIKLYKE
jgi:uncharacterized membrane protein